MDTCTPIVLPSLTEWSKTHVQHMFEARSDADCVAAIEDTFTSTVDATLNGRSLTLTEITQLVLAIVRSGDRTGPQGGVTVHWQYTLEAPDDPRTNRDGSFGGLYTLRGLRIQLPGTSSAAEFERHKHVSVRIESQSSDPTLDSRKISKIVFVASNVRVDDAKSRS